MKNVTFYIVLLSTFLKLNASEDEILFKKAEAWYIQGHSQEAKRLFNDIVTDFPHSQSAQDSQFYLDTKYNKNKNGKIPFIRTSTIASALLGFSVIYGFDLDFDDVMIPTWGTFGSALLGLGSSIYLSRQINISYSQGIYFEYLPYWGFLNGILLYDLFFDLNDRNAFLAGATGMSALLTAMVFTWDHLDVDPGAARLSTTLATYTLEMAFFIALAIGRDQVFDSKQTLTLTTLIIPSNAALIGGYYLGKKLKWSEEDIRLISIGGIIGNLLGAAVNATFSLDFDRAGAFVMMGSILAGLGSGIYLLEPWKNSKALAWVPNLYFTKTIESDYQLGFRFAF